jgi:hypothetical protein
MLLPSILMRVRALNKTSNGRRLTADSNRMDRIKKGKSKKVKGKSENSANRHVLFNFYPLPFTFCLDPVYPC